MIFSLSNQDAVQSNGTSSGVIQKLLEYFGIELSQNVVRKTAHALEYFGLCLLFYNAYYQTFRKVQPALSLISTALYACTDEIHQYFVLGRACMLRDVFIDTSGALSSILFCSIVYLIIIKISKQRKREV